MLRDLSSVLVHLVAASHPIHLLFHMQWNTPGAATSHAGFEGLKFRGHPVLYPGSFHQQLHDRLFNCNFGNLLTPLDRRAGSHHDGSRQAADSLRGRGHRLVGG